MRDVNDVAAAVLGELGSMDAMKLQKLVYYTQAWHLAISGEPLFADPILAFAQGPVVDALYQQHKRRRTVPNWPSGDANRLAEDDLALVGLVCNQYGEMSGDELSELTHDEKPWLIARGGLPDGQPSRTPLSHADMTLYYRDHRLGGWHAADLAAGGIHPMPAAPPAADYKQALAALRDEYAGQPAVAPAPGETYGRGKNPPPTEEELAQNQRTRGRVRPERRRAHA